VDFVIEDGGGEAIGILQSDEEVINAFRATDYKIHQTTTWFHLDLQNYTPVITAETVGYYGTIEIEFREFPKAKTWWEGCMFTNGTWFDAIAFSVPLNRPVARLRTRITHPDAENIFTMYGCTWIASLIELRVHPDFDDMGLKRYLLGELLRYLMAQHQIVQVEAHASEDSMLFGLLRNQCWQERDHGYVFVK
jgi:hypothetical protein